MGRKNRTLTLPGDMAARGDGTPDPEGVVERLRALPPGVLPLQGACSRGGIADESGRTIGLAGRGTPSDRNTIDLEVFFTEIVGGCSCHDDPGEFPCLARLRVGLGAAGELRVVALDDD